MPPAGARSATIPLRPWRGRSPISLPSRRPSRRARLLRARIRGPKRGPVYPIVGYSRHRLLLAFPVAGNRAGDSFAIHRDRRIVRVARPRRGDLDRRIRSDGIAGAQSDGVLTLKVSDWPA
jgi:hypothetical protein